MPRRFGWKPSDDAKLKRLVQLHGDKAWTLIAMELPGREAKQCRERWINHLASGIQKGKLSDQEWEKVQTLQLEFGNRYAYFHNINCYSEFSAFIPFSAFAN